MKKRNLNPKLDIYIEIYRIMSKIVKLTESDLLKIVKNVMNEGPDDPKNPLGPGWFNKGPGPGGLKSTTTSKNIVMGGGLFANGMSQIDTGSAEFKKGTDAISDAIMAGLGGRNGGTISVTVSGGVSAVPYVGDTTINPKYKIGQKNVDLANNRSKNFINACKSNPRFKNVSFSIGEPIIGKQTKRGAAADAEQLVQLSFTKTTTSFRDEPAVDNTAARYKGVYPVKKKEEHLTTDVTMTTICFQVPKSSLKSAMDIVSKIPGSANIKASTPSKSWWDRLFNS